MYCIKELTLFTTCCLTILSICFLSIQSCFVIITLFLVTIAAFRIAKKYELPLLGQYYSTAMPSLNLETLFSELRAFACMIKIIIPIMNLRLEPLHCRVIMSLACGVF